MPDQKHRRETMVEVMKFFGMRPTDFRKEWAELTDTDRDQLKAVHADGSLTY
jgi:hypothetical protein